MKTQLTFLVLLISIISVAQNGINYKALIKDATGNVISNEEIDVVFRIGLFLKREVTRNYGITFCFNKPIPIIGCR